MQVKAKTATTKGDVNNMPKGQQNNNKPRIDRSIEKIPVARENQNPNKSTNKQSTKNKNS